MQGLFAMHRSWQKFDELHSLWNAQERELVDENDQLKANATAAAPSLEENDRLRAEAEAAKRAAAEIAKETKEVKEELRTCRLDRDYHKEATEKKCAFARKLQDNLQVEVLKCE